MHQIPNSRNRRPRRGQHRQWPLQRRLQPRFRVPSLQSHRRRGCDATDDTWSGGGGLQRHQRRRDDREGWLGQGCREAVSNDDGAARSRGVGRTRRHRQDKNGRLRSVLHRHVRRDSERGSVGGVREGRRGLGRRRLRLRGRLAGHCRSATGGQRKRRGRAARGGHSGRHNGRSGRLRISHDETCATAAHSGARSDGRAARRRKAREKRHHDPVRPLLSSEASVHATRDATQGWRRVHWPQETALALSCTTQVQDR